MAETPRILETQTVSAGCRAGRGVEGAWDEAVRRLREIYDAQVEYDAAAPLTLAIVRGDMLGQLPWRLVAPVPASPGTRAEDEEGGR